MMSAARTASGRLLNSGVKAITVTIAEYRGDERRHLRARAGALVDRGLREAAAGGQAAHEAGAEVRDAERDHLLVGVDLVAVLRGERLRGPERLAEDDEHHPRRDRRQLGDVAAVEVRHVRLTAARSAPRRRSPRRGRRGRSAPLSTMPSTSTIRPPGSRPGRRSAVNSSDQRAHARRRRWRRSRRRGARAARRTG